MVKKSTLSKKLASYSALATAMLAVNHEANAQIIYTDLNPPVIIPYPIQFQSNHDTSAYLDLNNDGTPDFQFYETQRFRTSANSFESAYSSDNNISVKGLHKDTVNRVGLYNGQIPGSVPNSLWAGGAVLARDTVVKLTTFYSGYTLQFATHSGNFYYATNKYLPLKFKNNGNTYYGWARLITVAADELFIADYAYDTTPNAPIAAGNTGCNFPPITPVVTIKTDTLESTSAKKYQWYFDGAAIPGDTLSSVTQSQQGYYAVLTTDSNGCLSESQAKYFSCYSVKSLISETPGFSNPSCGPAEVQADNLVGGTSIQWLKDGAVLTGAAAPTYLADSSGSYSAEFIDSGKTCYLISDTVPITIDVEYPTIGQSTNDTLLTQHYSSYQWYLDSVAAGGTGQYFIADTTGKYFVIITDSNGCSFKSPDYNFTATGIAPLDQADVSIYAYDKRLHVLFNDESLVGSPLRIYNTLGQEVYSTILTTGQTEIDMSDLVAGIYIVEVRGKTAPVVKKIVVE
jgi:hypothetical protein